MSSAPVLPLANAQARLGRPGRPRKAALADQAVAAVSPGATRLLGVRATAGYLGLSERMVHELRASGRLQPVRLPLAGDREIRKLLFDRADLDRLIEASKDQAR